MSKKTLTLEMAGLFLFVIIFLGYLIFSVKGNPFMLAKSKRQIEAYVTENLNDVVDNFQASDVVYDAKTHTYQKRFSDKLSSDWYFTVTYHKDKTITDDYQESYIEGKYLLNERSSEATQKLQSALANLEGIEEAKLTFTLTLDEIDELEKNNIITGKELENISLYTLVGTCNVDKITAEVITDQLKKTQLELEPILTLREYQLTFVSKSEKITITLASEKLVSPNLLGMIELGLESPRKGKENYDIIIEKEEK